MVQKKKFCFFIIFLIFLQEFGLVLPYIYMKGNFFTFHFKGISLDKEYKEQNTKGGNRLTRIKCLDKDGNIFYKAGADAMFKTIFGDERDNELLEKLLEVTLGEKVKVEKILNPGILKTNVRSKDKTLDLLVRGEDNTLYNIEVNMSYYKHLNRRNAAFVFSKYSEDLKISDSYKDMNKIIQINLTSELSDNELINEYKLIDENTKKEYIDNLVIYEFNLDKLKEVCYNKEEFNKYKILVSLICDDVELHDICKGDKLLEKLERKVIEMNKDPEFIEFMSEEEEMEKLQNTLVENAREEGTLQGLEQGLEKGSKETQLEIAKNMLLKNIDIELISEVTSLPKGEIENLK